MVDTDPAEPKAATVAFRPARVERLLGTAIGVDAQRAVLARVGVETEPAEPGTEVVLALEPQPLAVPAGDALTLLAHVPSWRRDLAIEADITEEVARVRGYELTPGILPHTPMPAYRPSPLRLRDHVRSILVGAGLQEVVGYALVAPATVERFGGHDDADVASEGRVQGRPIVVTNPLSSQHSVMRQELLGGLLEVVADNQRRGREGVAIFEIGSGYGATDEGAVQVVAAGVRVDRSTRASRLGPGHARPELGDGKGLLELLASSLGLPAVTYATLRDDPRLHPGRAALVRAGEGMAGRIGELHPTLAETLELRGHRVIVGQVAIAGLSAGAPPVPVGRPRHAIRPSPGTWPSSSPTTARPPRSRRPSGATPARSSPACPCSTSTVAGRWPTTCAAWPIAWSSPPTGP